MYINLNANKELKLSASNLLAHLSQKPINLLVTKKMNFHVEEAVFPDKQGNIVENYWW